LDAIDADIVLTAPAHAASLQLIRTVAASAGARFGLSIDDIEDLRLAVTEAGVELIDRKPRIPGRTVTLRISERADALDVALTVDVDRVREAPPDGAVAPPGIGGEVMTPEESLAWQVLLALVDDVRFVFEDGIGLAFSKHRLDGSGI
jgi:anti-sigma regulatory factor (Ser/Thr protein kinase)